MSERIDVLAVMDAVIEGMGGPTDLGLSEARAAVAELVERADMVAATLEMPTLVKQSGKNANAGFIDMRDWFALVADVRDLRAALARIAPNELHDMAAELRGRTDG